ncbi:MAG: hypothetical protein WKG07_20585 [Hymenobacter sp.]
MWSNFFSRNLLKNNLMAWIGMYLLQPDVELLNEWLNKETEIAFLVSNGPNQWIAQERRNIVDDLGKQLSSREHNFSRPDYAEYNLWHVPSGDLPLLEGSIIPNPWAGWTEIRDSRSSRVPDFGAGHPGIIRLEIKLQPVNEIPISNFGWIGNHYRIIGFPAERSTEIFWKRLRGAIKKMSTQIPRSNDTQGKNEIFAFPAAYQEIKNGRPCALNPY